MATKLFAYRKLCFWWQLGCQCRFKVTSLFSLLLLPAKGNHSRWDETSYTWPDWRSKPLACLKMGKTIQSVHSLLFKHSACIRPVYSKNGTTAFRLSITYIFTKRDASLQTSKSLSTAQRDIWGPLLQIQQGGHYQPKFTELSSCESLFNVRNLTLKQQSYRIVVGGRHSSPNFSESTDDWDNAQLFSWHEATECL